jgi:hypothetical protein
MSHLSLFHMWAGVTHDVTFSELEVTYINYCLQLYSYFWFIHI